ncbi:MAG: hypothetical protein DCC56_02785 [Anaerolineae bacterium]|nr:MAG: hypothetical protein DCC56_02785 [Anaerolineae bacterium]
MPKRVIALSVTGPARGKGVGVGVSVGVDVFVAVGLGVYVDVGCGVWEGVIVGCAAPHALRITVTSKIRRMRLNMSVSFYDAVNSFDNLYPVG